MTVIFLIYINDLPNLASTGTKILLYADNTSIIVTSSNLENFETKIDIIFGDINNWFKVNQLILSYNKTNYLQFNMENSWDCEMKPNYQGNCIKSSSNTKFLGLTIDDSFSWKSSYRPNNVQIEYSMFCNSNNTSYNVFRNIKNGVLCIHTFNYKLRDNFWGKSTI